LINDKRDSIEEAMPFTIYDSRFTIFLFFHVISKIRGFILLLFEKTKPIFGKGKRKKAKMSVNLVFIRVNSWLIPCLKKQSQC